MPQLPATIKFEPRRFESAAQYYLEGRPGYAGRLIDRVSSRLGFDGTQTLLDLGTGPGMLAIAFAPHVGAVTAVDPEPGMLQIAAAEAARAGVQLMLLEGSSYTLDKLSGPFDLVTIGRAFHWMDRPRTVEILDTLIRPGGAIALFATRHPNVPGNGWRKDFTGLIDAHSEPNSHREVMRSPDWVPQETIMFDSPFSMLERITIIERRATPVEHFVTRALSQSTTSPGRIAGRAEDLAQVVRATLSAYATDGIIREVVESEAVLAFRPA
jgi:2-polyprenyl-3-methyl-5-hydroxy-6-metoxy-1,4-benzoquinol methylase